MLPLVSRDAGSDHSRKRKPPADHELELTGSRCHSSHLVSTAPNPLSTHPTSYGEARLTQIPEYTGSTLRIETGSAIASVPYQHDRLFQPSPRARAALRPFSFRHRLIRCARPLEALGFDLSGQSHGSARSPILQRCSRTSVPLHTGTITNYCHTWLDFRHITIATHQNPSPSSPLGPRNHRLKFPPGRNNLVCTEDELGPWPHHWRSQRSLHVRRI